MNRQRRRKLRRAAAITCFAAAVLLAIPVVMRWPNVERYGDFKWGVGLRGPHFRAAYVYGPPLKRPQRGEPWGSAQEFMWRDRLLSTSPESRWKGEWISSDWGWRLAIPLWPFSVAAFGAGLVLWTRKHLSGSCPHCGYDMSGLPAPLCPECGREAQSSPAARR